MHTCKMKYSKPVAVFAIFKLSNLKCAKFGNFVNSQDKFATLDTETDVINGELFQNIRLIRGWGYLSVSLQNATVNRTVGLVSL